MVIGQELICNKIYTTTLDSFPRTLMLIGDCGSGKHLICTEISQHLSLQQRDLTAEISLDIIDELYNRTDPFLYIIDIDKLSIKEQNMILKFIEEPLKNSFIVILTEAGANVLATIFNRCQQWRLQSYNKEYLKTFTDNANILRLATTPGQILDFINCDFESLFELADKIVSKIGAANLPNALTITNKITVKDEKGKIPANLLIKALIATFRDACIENCNSSLISAYKRTQKLSCDSKIKNVDLKYLFDKYIIEIREIMRGQ